MASAIHLLVGARLGAAKDARRRVERRGAPDSIFFNESVATPESEGEVGAAIENLILINVYQTLSDKKNSLLR